MQQTHRKTDPPQRCELLVIGAGMAGMAAALFAARRGIDTILVGESSEIIFASGLMDLMGVHPLAQKRVWHDPWAAIRRLCRDLPAHPYAHIPEAGIRRALETVFSFLESAGLRYFRRPQRNCRVLTALGSEKITYGVPRTMAAGVQVLERKKPCRIVDIQGLKGFSSRLIVRARHRSWPGMDAARIVFPGMQDRTEVYAEQMARALEVPRQREELARVLAPHVKGVAAVGMPAIFGMYHSDAVCRDLEQCLGVPLFEIPTFPPCVPGLRLKEAFERRLPELGVRLITGKRVVSADVSQSNGFAFGVGDDLSVAADAAVLASGRFLGKGLWADRRRVRESLFDLPVCQPDSRRGWHRRTFLDSRGHPLNQAGLEIDARFRPLGAGGRPVHRRLYAAGSILAHQDWMRAKCGSGLSIASAWAAVEAFIRERG